MNRTTLAPIVLCGLGALASGDEPVRVLADWCPSIFSIEIGNDRIRMPVA